jgi:hypothetical protein
MTRLDISKTMTDIFSADYAQQLDAQDPIHRFRDEFRLPTNRGIKADLVPAEQGTCCAGSCGHYLSDYSGFCLPLLCWKLFGSFAKTVAKDFERRA